MAKKKKKAGRKKVSSKLKPKNTLPQSWNPPAGFYFDEAAASKAEEFFERFLFHVKGRWMGQRFKFLPWQRTLIRTIFGWMSKNGTRRYRTVYIEVPRKNGKSEFSAGIALYMLFADGEKAGEVYSAAADREQAAIVFDMAKQMREFSPSLRRRSKKYRRSIYVPKTASAYKVLSADAFTKDGLSASAIIFDELHTQKNRELWDVLTTSTGARTQPLTVAITTAGTDRHSICWEVRDFAKKVIKGIINDPAFLSVIYAADEEDDWQDPKTWEKANPSYGVTISKEYLAREAEGAKHSPARENTFKRLHLNIWTKQITRWLPIWKWDDSAGDVDQDELEGKPCYGGLDLASTTDIAAFIKLFPLDGDIKVVPRFWIPEEKMMERSKRDHVPYETWVDAGLIEATPGNVIDYSFIQARIEEDGKFFDLKEIGYDPWNATQIVQNLMNEGATMVPVRQGFTTMAGPMREFERLVLGKMIHHGGHSVLRWMIDNLAVKTDPAGNTKPDKSKSTEKIDGVVALVMALDRLIRNDAVQKESVYNERGLIII